MKKHYAFVSILAGVLLAALSGCGMSEDDKTVPPGIEDDPYLIGSGAFTITLPHYLLCFFEPESFDVSVNDDKRLISVDFKIIEFHTQYYDFRDAENPDKYPEEAEIYESLCERYKDTSYSTEQRMMPYWNGRRYPVNNIVSIEIVSDADYDKGHPAGSSLADICELFTASPRDFIASGYTDNYESNWDLETLALFGEDKIWTLKVKPIHKRLDKCWAEDLVLAGYYPKFFKLRFPQAPAANFEGSFTIKLLDEKGQVFTLKTEPVSW